jgi:MFS family permease
MHTQRLPRNVKLLAWASCLNDIASEMVYPLIPQFLISTLGGNRFYLGLVEGLADSAGSLLKLWAGAWSDRTGRRRAPVIWGYALAAAARPVMGIVVAPWQLLAARAGDRIGKGIRTSPRDALIADSSQPTLHGRAFGFHRGMDHVGAAIGPVLATVLLWNWPDQLRGLFLLTAVPGLAAVGMLVFFLREVGTGRLAPARLPSTSQPFGRNFQLYMLALFVFTLGNSSDAFLLVRAAELGVATTMLPLLWFVFHLVKSTGNMVAGRAVDRIGPRIPIIAGWLVYSAVYLAFALATAAWHAWFLFLAYAVFYALTEPAEKVLVARLAGAAQKGLAFGWYNFALGIAALPSSLVFGTLYERCGPAVAFGWGAVLAFAALVLLAFVTPARVT